MDSGTIFRNQNTEDGVAIRHKTRLIAQGYTLMEEVLVRFVRFDSIRTLLCIACASNSGYIRWWLREGF